MALERKHAAVKLGDLSVAFVHSLSHALSERGFSSVDLLRQFHLSPARLAQPRERLSIPRYMRLGHSAIGLTKDPALGLAMGRHSQISHAGLAGITASQAPTLREAAHTLLRLEPLYAHNYRGRSSFIEETGGAWLCFYSISPYNDFNRFVVDSVLASWWQQLSQALEQVLPVERVEIEYPAPAYADRYEQHFNCTVQFASRANRLFISDRYLDSPLPKHCPSTWQHLLLLAEHELEQLTRTRSLRERIIHLLGPMLLGREPSLEEVAAKLHLPSWTLRRKLAEEGTQYRAILNDTRHDLAMTYIRDTELAFGEIAYLLGFASAEAFQRAFKRWSGETPGDFRRQQRRNGL